MLSHLDRIIFPDRCEVIEVIPAQRYVFPIFKNGSSSLYKEAENKGWRIRFNEQIRRIHSIDVILRNPKDRLISGINSYIKITVRENPELDIKTIQWFALNYLYLNSHYCPQFLWLINLSRFTTPETKLNFLSMSELKTMTQIDQNNGGFGAPTDELIELVELTAHNEMYQRVDLVLFNAIDHTMTLNQLWNTIKASDPVAYDYVIGYAQKLLATTYALP